MAVLINDTSALVAYTATAGQTVFVVPFEFFAVTDIVVERNGVALAYNASPSSVAQFSVAGANVDGGGSVTLGGGATLADRIVIYRDLPFERRANYPETGPFDIRALNTEQARQIAMMQQLRSELDLTLKVAKGETPVSINAFVASITLAGTTQVGLVNTAGSTQVAAVNAAGVSQIALATTQATAAAASAATAALSPGTSATSTTSLLIGTGSKSLTIETGKQFALGQFVIVSRTSAPNNWMFGQITAFTSGTGALTVNAQATNGSGTFTDWTVALSGPSGSVGVVDIVSGTTGTLTVARGGTGATTAAGARTALGSTTVGDGLFTLANPSAVRFLRVNADNSVSARTAAEMLSDIAGAPLASPAFTGNPTAPTAAVGDNDTSLATTAFVQAELMASVQALASGTTITPDGNVAGNDAVVITALAANATIAAPTGSPVQMKPLIFRIKDNGTIRTLTWNAIYRAIGVTLPTATVANKTIYVGFLYNTTDAVWDCVLVRQQA